MPSDFNTTFIPKSGDVGNVPKFDDPGNESKVIPLLTFVAGIFAILAVATVGIVFVMNRTVINDVSVLKSRIEKKSQTIDDELLAELKLFSDSVSDASQLLNGHSGYSLFVWLFSSSIIPEISFKNFSLSLPDSENGEIVNATIDASIYADDYERFIQQGVVWDAVEYVKDYDITVVEMGRDGGAPEAAVSMEIDSRYLNMVNYYNRSLIGGSDVFSEGEGEEIEVEL